MKTDKDFKSGFVALIGQPNVGKSTLMNYLVGEKVAITSSKPQTTRNQITGILTNKQMQVMMVDTPGIFHGRTKLDDYMDQASWLSLKKVDLVLLLVEPTLAHKNDLKIAQKALRAKIPVFLVINKIDRIHPNKLLPIIDSYRQAGHFAEILPISASKGIGIPDLEQTIKKYLPRGPQYYNSAQITDRPTYFLVAELIREQILRFTRQEVPHACAVAVEDMKERINGKLQVRATIYVEKKGQKGIIIGKGGQMLKNIGINARLSIQRLLGEKINLRLWVKVQPNWRSDPNFLKQIGYNKKELG